MRLLADENVPRPSIAFLRGVGLDVVAVADVAPRASDTSILELARRERRLVVTFDRDYGSLVFRRLAPAHPGVIYLRFVPATPTEAGELLASLAAVTGLTFEGYFTVVDRRQVRRRPLPEPPAGAVRERSPNYVAA